MKLHPHYIPMTREQAINCKLLAEILQAVKPEQYNHSFFVDENDCGTVACALGWAAVNGLANFSSDGKVVHYKGSVARITTRANNEFGLKAYEQIFDTPREFSLTDYASKILHETARAQGWEPANRQLSIDLLLERVEMYNEVHPELTIAMPGE